MKTQQSNIVENFLSESGSVLSFFDSLSEPFVIISQNGEIVYSNKKACNLFNYDTHELQGKHFNSLVVKRFREGHKDYFEKNILTDKFTRETTPISFIALDKSGTVHYLEVSLNKIIQSDTFLYGCFLKDKTDSIKELQKLRKERQKALTEAKIKTEFLAQMSHEIRSPVNLIMNFSGLVREVLDRETQQTLKEEFAIITNAGKRIIRTIDLVLNMSEIQSGQFEIQKTKFDLYEEILDRINKEFYQIAKQKGLTLSLKKETSKTNVFADEYCVFQCFMNIVDNAIKYTEEGYIDIVLGRDDEKNLCVKVSDTGIGMSEEYQKDLFKPFHQEDHSFVKKFQGNGLGLALVKKYCELNDIEITVESKKNVGTTFKVTFPQ